jgi:hypothetical protein
VDAGFIGVERTSTTSEDSPLCGGRLKRQRPSHPIKSRVHASHAGTPAHSRPTTLREPGPSKKGKAHGFITQSGGDARNL